jgi:hypothetical protein
MIISAASAKIIMTTSNHPTDRMTWLPTLRPAGTAVVVAVLVVKVVDMVVSSLKVHFCTLTQKAKMQNSYIIT